MLRGTETIQEVKEKLTSLGISTTTPGLKGDERLQELVKRLDEYYEKENELQQSIQQNVISIAQKIESQYNVPSVSDLSLSEIRSRLTMFGESTATPGLAGEDRRNELLKRLVNSICRSDDTGNQIIDEIIQQEAKPPSTDQNMHKDIGITPQEQQFKPQQTAELENVNESEISKTESLKKEERIRTTELNEIKKHLNGLMNRRAISISSRYEGTNQDDKLRHLSSLSGQFEQEINRVQILLKKNKSGKAIHSSSLMIENNSMMSAEKLISKLNKEFDATKEKIKRQKNKIKCEEENNEVYGLEAEEIDKIRIQELSFQISKIKRDIEKLSVGVSVSDQPLSTQKTQSSSSREYVRSSSHSQDLSSESQPKPPPQISSVGNSRSSEEDKEKIVKKKQAPVSDPFDASPGIGFSEDELLSMKPFQPYKETDGDDLLALKMEMLRNRHKSSSSQLKKIESLPPDEKMFQIQTAATEINDVIPHPTAPAPPVATELKSTQVSPEIGSKNTAFSSRRPHHQKNPPPPKVDQAKNTLGSKGEAPLKSHKEEDADRLLPVSDSKITKLRQELAAHNDDSDEDNDEDSDNEEEVDIQLKELRAEALTLEKTSKFDEVEEIYVRALNMKPFDVRTLDSFATFLHRRKGEMGRAEAFYRRAIQICLPSLIDDLTSPSKKLSQGDWKQILRGEPHPPAPAPPPEGGRSALSVKRLTSVLLHYANFLRRAKGDLDLAEVVLRKAAEISPTDDVVLGNCAHHLAEEAYDRAHHHDHHNADSTSADKMKEAAELFQRAMKANPKNVNNMLWYAKFLHKTNQIIQAEIMYKAALQTSQFQKKEKVKATAICNYAIFLYRHKKDPEQAAQLFCEGIERFPTHRGIQKNYKAMQKDLQRMITQSRQMKEKEEVEGEDRARGEAQQQPLQQQQKEKEDEKQDEEEGEGGDDVAVRRKSMSRESNAHTARMAGMRAKLYHDVQSAEDYQLLSLEAQSKHEQNLKHSQGKGESDSVSDKEIKKEREDGKKGDPLDAKQEPEQEEQEEEEEDENDGLFSFSIHQMSCSSLTLTLTQLEKSKSLLYWIFNAGSGSISDQSYESSSLSLQQQVLEWNYENPVTGTGSIDENHSSLPLLAAPPVASVSCHDHLCFEYYQIKEFQSSGQFLGSVLIPIEDLLLNLPTNRSEAGAIACPRLCVEETIMSDEGAVIGQMVLHYSLL